jgi:hypothetical protein
MSLTSKRRALIHLNRDWRKPEKQLVRFRSRQRFRLG